MATAPLAGEQGQGIVRTVTIYEGDATRYDVWTKGGIVEQGVTYAAGISQDRIDDGNAYVKRYTTYKDSVQRVATGENGDQIIGRVLTIDRNIPEIAVDGGTWTATEAGARKASVEFFVSKQVIRVRAKGDAVGIVVGNTLSLVAGSLFLMDQDLVNGAFYALEPTTDADAYILVEV